MSAETLTTASSRKVDSTRELVLAARRGDDEAYAELVATHLGLVHAIALARLVDRQAADDLVQEVFLRAWLHLDKLGPPFNFGGWIVQIARNESIRWNRDNLRHTAMFELLPESADLSRLASAQTDARAEVAHNEETQNLLGALEQISSEDRETLLLHYSEGMTKREIAECTGVHESTIGRQIKRTLAQLRTFMEEPDRTVWSRLGPASTATSRAVGAMATVLTLPPTVKAQLATALPVPEATNTTLLPDKPGLQWKWIGVGGLAGLGLIAALWHAGTGGGESGAVPSASLPATTVLTVDAPNLLSAPARTDAATVAENEGNLLFNGSFEDGNGEPAHWKKGVQGGGGTSLPDVQWVYSRDRGHTGTSAIGFHREGRRYFPIAEWYQDVEHHGMGDTIRVSAMVAAKDVTKARLDVQFLTNVGGWSHAWVSSIGGGGDSDPVSHNWTEYSGTATVPEGTDRIRVSIQIYGPGMLLVDDVRAEYPQP